MLLGKSCLVSWTWLPPEVFRGRFETWHGMSYTVYLYVFWAAFETISTMTFHPHHANTEIDIRRTRLPSIRIEDYDYDPRDHRSPPAPIKLWMAYFNLLRSMCSSGMLAMPLIISQAGILLGPILTLVTGCLIIYTHFMLLDCLYEIARQLKIPYISYRYGFRLALLHGPPAFHCIGKRGPQIIATFMFASQLGICTVFVIFSSDSVRDLMDWQSNEPALLCVLFPYLLLEFFMKNLSIVSYVAMFGNFLNLGGLILVFEHVINDANGGKMTMKTHGTGILFAFGSLLFNLSAVGVVLSLDKQLKDTRKMWGRYGVINIGILLPTILSILFGCLGYYAFGTLEENIIRSLPFDEETSMAAIGLYVVAVAFAYPLQCYPAIATLVEVVKYHDPMSTPSQHTLSLIQAIGRPLFVVLTFIISYYIPFQGPFVAFVGNLCTSMLALVFPALMDLCLRYPYYYGRGNVHLIKDIIIISLGLTAVTFGVFFCGYLIYIRVLSKHSPNYTGFF